MASGPTFASHAALLLLLAVAAQRPLHAQQPAAPTPAAGQAGAAAPGAAAQSTATSGGARVRPAPSGTRPSPRRPVADLPGIREFARKSACVSEFWGVDRSIEAGVVEPLDRKQDEKLPIAFNIHGFGGDHTAAWQQGPGLQKAMASGAAPRMLHVFLNAQWEWGHHEFADSRAGGPWGKALTEEFIPALEAEHGGAGVPAGRLLTGHSSGGWSVLWLQVAYPDFFGGCWATSPDSVDFRDFTGIDIYSFENAFTDPEGQPIMLVRRRGQFVSSIQQFMQMEQQQQPIGGQFFSFNAVFSELGPDGMPKRLVDPATGAIDSAVADSWQPFDLSLKLQREWPVIGSKLKGKLHLYMGLIDTFRLEGATILLKEELAKLGSDADIVLVEDRDHGSIYAPHPELWPRGMMERIHREMWEQWETATGK
jgi:S-formylglutathione hydrolase FrmB